jgi:hypothetical protein
MTQDHDECGDDTVARVVHVAPVQADWHAVAAVRPLPVGSSDRVTRRVSRSPRVRFQGIIHNFVMINSLRDTHAAKTATALGRLPAGRALGRTRRADPCFAQEGPHHVRSRSHCCARSWCVR